MTSFRNALLFGVIIWVISVTFFVFPIRESWRALFESIIPVVMTIVTILFSVVYFKKVESGFIKEGVVVGLLWLFISLLISLPIVLLNIPIGMSFTFILVDFIADIGLTYLMIPVITIGMGMAIESKAKQLKKE